MTNQPPNTYTEKQIAAMPELDQKLVRAAIAKRKMRADKRIENEVNKVDK